MDTLESHVQAKFFTSLKEYEMKENSFSLPVSSSPTELNLLLQSLLFDENTEPNDKALFDFLVQNQFLTGSLKEFIDQKSLGTESVIEIEYILKEELPELQKSVKQNDWVSCLDVSSENKIISGCYDSSLTLINGHDGQSLSILKHHEMPVKSAKWVNSKVFISSSQDQTVIIWGEPCDSNGTFLPKVSCRGHSSSVDCVAVSVDKEKFASGSYDKSIKIWNVKEDDEINENNEVSRKKKKTNNIGNQSIPIRTPLRTFSSHDDAVSCLQWSTENELISSSLDHCIKIWDIETSQNKNTITGKKSILSISVSPMTKQIASGNTDNIVRIWDTRSESGVVVKGTLTAHKNWVATVNWSPSNVNHLISGSYDSKLFLWDVRKMTDTLKEIGNHKDKILCSYWNKDFLLSGSADCNINFYQR